MPNNIVLGTRHNTLQGIPSVDELKWVGWLPNGSYLFFSPISKVSGDDAVTQYNLTRKRSEEFGFDFIEIFVVGMMEMHHIVCIVFDRRDDSSRKRAHKPISVLVGDAARQGWGEYRTHLALMDQIADTYSFSNNAMAKLNHKIKDALDPKDILATGKNGVWGSQYEREAWNVPFQG